MCKEVSKCSFYLCNDCFSKEGSITQRVSLLQYTYNPFLNDTQGKFRVVMECVGLELTKVATQQRFYSFTSVLNKRQIPAFLIMLSQDEGKLGKIHIHGLLGKSRGTKDNPISNVQNVVQGNENRIYFTKTDRFNYVDQLCLEGSTKKGSSLKCEWSEKKFAYVFDAIQEDKKSILLLQASNESSIDKFYNLGEDDLKQFKEVY